MIPEQRLSTEPVTAVYLDPDILNSYKLQDYERGGIALHDPLQGLEYQNWYLTYDTPDVIVTPQTTGSASVLFSIADITEFSLAFDQNMHPFVTYVVNHSRFDFLPYTPIDVYFALYVVIRIDSFIYKHLYC